METQFNNDRYHLLSIKDIFPTIIIKGRVISTIGNYISNNNNNTLLTNLTSNSSNTFTYSSIDLSSNNKNCILLKDVSTLSKHSTLLLNNALLKLNESCFPFYPLFIFSPVNDNTSYIQCEIKCFYHNINFNMELITNDNLHKIKLVINIDNNKDDEINKVESFQHLYNIIENNKHIIYQKCYLFYKGLTVKEDNSFIICVMISQKFKVCYKITPILNNANVYVASAKSLSNYYFYGDDETNIEINLLEQLLSIESMESVLNKNNIMNNWIENNCDEYMTTFKHSNSKLSECSNMSQNTTNYSNESLMNSININAMIQKVNENANTIKTLTKTVDDIEKQIHNIINRLKET